MMSKAKLLFHPTFGRPSVENPKRPGRPAGVFMLARARRRKRSREIGAEWDMLTDWAIGAGKNHLLPLEQLRSMKAEADAEALARQNAYTEMQQIDQLMRYSYEIYEQAYAIKKEVLERYIKRP